MQQCYTLLHSLEGVLLSREFFSK